MLFDSHANFASSSVAVVPSPAVSGNQLTLKTGEGALFTATPPYNCSVINPSGQKEIVRLTARTGDVVTITRGQEGTTPMTIVVGAKFINSITAKTLSDLENSVPMMRSGKVLDGFGVVYANLQPNWQTDIKYFKYIGLQNVRVTLPYFPQPWAAGVPVLDLDSQGVVGFPHVTANNYAFWRLCAKTFVDAGFNVAFGPALPTGTPPLTAAKFAQYQTDLVSEAQYLIAQNIKLTWFELGNENENQVSGGSDLTIAQFNQGLRNTAANIKALPGWSALGTQLSFGMSFNPTAATDWVNNGLGALDTLGVHPYGDVVVASQTVNGNNFATSQYQALIDANPGKIYLGEFNLDSANNDILQLSLDNRVAAMNNILNTYIRPNMDNGKLRSFMVYKYVEGLNNSPGDLGYTMLLPQSAGYYPNTFSPMWDCFFKS